MTVPLRPSSNRTGGFPASGFPKVIHAHRFYARARIHAAADSHPRCRAGIPAHPSLLYRGFPKRQLNCTWVLPRSASSCFRVSSIFALISSRFSAPLAASARSRSVMRDS
jgi:hypothetical protein